MKNLTNTFPPLNANKNNPTTVQSDVTQNSQSSDEYEDTYELWEEIDSTTGNNTVKTTNYRTNKTADNSKPSSNKPPSASLDVVNTESNEDYELYDVKEENKTHIYRNVPKKSEPNQPWNNKAEEPLAYNNPYDDQAGNDQQQASRDEQGNENFTEDYQLNDNDEAN